MLAVTNNSLFRRRFVRLLFAGAAVVLATSTAIAQPGGLHHRYCPYPLGCQPSSAAVPLNVVRLYEDKGFDGRYVDLALSNFGDNELHSLSQARFGNEASSARWNLEQGVIVILYEEDDHHRKGEQYPIWMQSHPRPNDFRPELVLELQSLGIHSRQRCGDKRRIELKTPSRVVRPVGQPVLILIVMAGYCEE